MEHWHIILITCGVQILIGLFVAIIAFLLKRSIYQIDSQLKAGSDEFKSISEQLTRLKEQRGFDREYFAKEYVAKDDFIRDVRALDYKVETVARDVKKLLVLTGGRDQDAAV